MSADHLEEQDARTTTDANEEDHEATAPPHHHATVVQPPPLPVDWTQLGVETTAPPVRYPSDVADIDADDDELVIVGTAGQKITVLGDAFSSLLNPALSSLVLRSHLIRKMQGLQGLTKLQVLELYDNQVDALECLEDCGPSLRVLDMSYNVIRDMSPVQLCPNLKELYLANNKLKSMAGLRGLSQLQKIDLGANRIRVMDGDELSGLVHLEELWLGKNKIERMQGLEKLTKLRRLDVQSNRLEAIEGLTSQNATLEELYLAHNGITNEGASAATGLALALPNLSVLDLSRNRLTSTAAFEHLTSLEELWLSGNKIASFDDVQPLAKLGQHLETVYLEYNPLQEDPLYRKKLKELIPSLTQIDANLIQGLSSMGLPPSAGRPVETEEERLRGLQAMAVERAKAETKTKQQSDGK